MASREARPAPVTPPWTVLPPRSVQARRGACETGASPSATPGGDETRRCGCCSRKCAADWIDCAALHFNRNAAIEKIDRQDEQIVVRLAPDQDAFHPGQRTLNNADTLAVAKIRIRQQ